MSGTEMVSKRNPTDLPGYHSRAKETSPKRRNEVQVERLFQAQKEVNLKECTPLEVRPMLAFKPGVHLREKENKKRKCAREFQTEITEFYTEITDLKQTERNGEGRGISEVV